MARCLPREVGGEDQLGYNVLAGLPPKGGDGARYSTASSLSGGRQPVESGGKENAYLRR